MAFRIGAIRNVRIEYQDGDQSLFATFESQESDGMTSVITRYRAEVAAITTRNDDKFREKLRDLSEKYFAKQCKSVEGYEYFSGSDSDDQLDDALWKDIMSVSESNGWADFVPREHKHGYWTAYVAVNFEKVGNE